MLEDHILSQISQGKTRVYDVPSRQNLKRDTKEVNYNTQVDSENSNTRIKKKNKGRANELIRRLGITHTQKSVSVLDAPQGPDDQHRELCRLSAKPLWQKNTIRTDTLYVYFINESGSCTLMTNRKPQN